MDIIAWLLPFPIFNTLTIPSPNRRPLFSVRKLMFNSENVYRTGPECRKNVWTFVYRAANPDKWSYIYAARSSRNKYTTYEHRHVCRTNRGIHFQSL